LYNSGFQEMPKAKKKASFRIRVPREIGRRPFHPSANAVFENGAAFDAFDVPEFDNQTLYAIVEAWRGCVGYSNNRSAILFRNRQNWYNYVEEAKKALTDWLGKRQLPENAIIYLTRNNVDIWETHPIVRELFIETLHKNKALRSAILDLLTHVDLTSRPNLRNYVEKCTADAGVDGDDVHNSNQDIHQEDPGAITVELEGIEYDIPSEIHDSNSDNWFDCEDILGALYNFVPPTHVDPYHESLFGQVVEKEGTQFLRALNTTPTDRLEGPELLQLWYTHSKSTQEALGLLLRLINEHEVVLDWRQLPRSAKTLLKLKPQDRRATIVTHRSSVLNADGQHDVIGEAIHYGILDSVTCSSPG
jgi:hypothetical protein